MSDSATLRRQLVEALEYNLIGPWPDHPLQEEELHTAPSRFYLTGFLVAQGAPLEQASDEDDEGELATEGKSGTDDNASPEPQAKAKVRLPSTVGLSLIVPKEAQKLSFDITWGEYSLEEYEDKQGKVRRSYRRKAQRIPLVIDLSPIRQQPGMHHHLLPEGNGLKIVVSGLPVNLPHDLKHAMPEGCFSLSIFLVNGRPAPSDAKKRDLSMIFQVRMRISSDAPIVARPNLQGLNQKDGDDAIADLQYRDVCEYAVGHGVSAAATIEITGQCHEVKTHWFPESEVEKVKPGTIEGAELGMDALAAMPTAAAIQQALQPLVNEYDRWLAKPIHLEGLSGNRLKVARELLHRGKYASGRIADGIACLEKEENLLAFKWANEAMAMAARQRLGNPKPQWRPFQLAFILMNLPGMADPTHRDRQIVDLLFFPTGGGKTEAYLGLAAFNLVQRRLRHAGGIQGAGIAVIMRYTLRLLTLDQLGRAAGLICALEILRLKNIERLGKWPFEIGLWVGTGATPNAMGEKGDPNQFSARAKLSAWKKNRIREAPIPLEKCPWCNQPLELDSFQLTPNQDYPNNLVIRCLNSACEFSAAKNRALPLVAVDEPLYRRLPCFLIATVDKFASLPWEGRTGALFGFVQRYDAEGFYGPSDPTLGTSLLSKPLDPPDLIIQDELHLISGPLGTVAGLYETALEQMCRRNESGHSLLPKIIASTATVRRAGAQIRALFGRGQTDVFPPPGPDRRNSFFAKTVNASESPARLYIGLAAQGRSPKEILLRACLTLMSRAESLSQSTGGRKSTSPADPYMTLLGYFNSIRELGGARRLFEGEVFAQLQGYSGRKRQNETESIFANREAKAEVLELTSRLSTSKVSEAKQALSEEFKGKSGVDIALATNMISVGLDIERLGLMVVYGQPKTTSEYIQATSRVGRSENKPGLVITVFNVIKPRDRSHYERFAFYHQTFYRAVEASSVTPFSARALDRSLVPVTVALARHGWPEMAPGPAANKILVKRGELDAVADILSARAKVHSIDLTDAELKELTARVRGRVQVILDDWFQVANEMQEAGTSLKYQKKDAGGKPLLHTLLDKELASLSSKHRSFIAPRSLRDVEPAVQLLVTNLDGTDAPMEDL